MGLNFSVGAISQAHGKVAHALKAPVAEAAASLCKAECVFRTIVTGRFGSVTAEFGSVTGHFGDVTDGHLVPA